MKRILCLFLLLASPAFAQKPPINAVAGPTNSAQLQSIITDATGSGPLNFGPTAANIQVGTTTIGGGTTTRFLYDNAGVLGDTNGLTWTSATSTLTSLGPLKVGDPALFGHPDNALSQVYRSVASPTNIQQTNRVVTAGKGNNTTYIGVVSGYYEARDRDDVTALNKGVLYSLSLAVVPIVGRNNVPYDDVDGLTISNITGVPLAKATDAIYISANTGTFGDKTTGNSEWYSLFTADANADVGIQLAGRIATWGIDLGNANLAIGGAMRLPNNTFIYARNAANTGDRRLFGLDTNNTLQLGGPSVSGVQVNNWFGETTPVVVSGTTYTVGSTDNALIFTNASGCTVTLPSAASFPGRIIWLRTTQAAAIISASSNVTPISGASPGTAILAPTVGEWAMIWSDSATWQVQGAGGGTFAGSIYAGASSVIGFTGRSQLQSALDGNLTMSNAAATDFGMLRWGGTTSSFPGLKRNGTELQARFADDSDFSPFSASRLGLGTASGSDKILGILTPVTGGTTAYGVATFSTVQSGVTTAALGFLMQLATQASSFTLADLHGFRVAQGTIGAGSAVTNQRAFSVAANFTGGTNNYAYTGDIPSGANNWNAYMAGTAQNWFAGNVGIGSGKSAPSVALDINGAVTATGAITFSGLTTDATLTTRTVCQNTADNTLHFGSGASGICLGTSSRRYKELIRPDVPGLTAIRAMEPVGFHYVKGYGDDGAREQYGFLAEEMIKAAPELVGLDKAGRPNTIDYMGVVPVLVQAVRELDAEVRALKSRDRH